MPAPASREQRQWHFGGAPAGCRWRTFAGLRLLKRQVPPWLLPGVQLASAPDLLVIPKLPGGSHDAVQPEQHGVFLIECFRTYCANLSDRHARKCESHPVLQEQLEGANWQEVTRSAIGVSHCGVITGLFPGVLTQIGLVKAQVKQLAFDAMGRAVQDSSNIYSMRRGAKQGRTEEPPPPPPQPPQRRRRRVPDDPARGSRRARYEHDDQRRAARKRPAAGGQQADADHSAKRRRAGRRDEGAAAAAAAATAAAARQTATAAAHPAAAAAAAAAAAPARWPFEPG